MISKRTESVLGRAVDFAVKAKHEYLTTEHVVLSLIEESEVIETIEACGGNVADVKQKLLKALAQHPTTTENEPVTTIGVQRLIQRALLQVQSSGKSEVQPIDLFVAIFQAKDSPSLAFLNQGGLERLEVVSYVSHGLSTLQEGDQDRDHQDPDLDPDDLEQGDARQSGQKKQSSSEVLKSYTEDLIKKAEQGKLDPIIGREAEIERVIQTLLRRKKNNPLLVGEAGVGKTAIAEGLASKIFEKQVPDLLLKAKVFSLDMGLLLAGAKFRGDFEQRLKKVIQSLQEIQKEGFIPILYIDEIHTLVGAGAVGGGSLDAANMLKPLLSSGEIQILGSTTYAEYRSVIEKDQALARRFQKIDVVEPTQAEAIQILTGLKKRFEEHHGVTYTLAALKTAVECSVKYLTDRFLPDKAIDVVDEAGAKARLKGLKIIDEDAIESVVAQIARIPVGQISHSQRDRLKTLDRDLKLILFGQDHAIDQIVNGIRLARSGLRGEKQPLGSYLMCGPTGVGKTELSSQLALQLAVPLLRFDMSEYSEKHTVSRLIGAPPGYVGYDQEGLLTGQVLKHPYAVVLLDEIEKAHPEVWNILLQVMDHGTLTDQNGRKVDFRNCIILMTSNVGSRDLERKPLGLDQALGATSLASAKKAVEQTFTPEFRNRLDGVIFFNPLDPKTMDQIVDRQITELESQLIQKKIEMEVNEAARKWLAVRGYDRALGARPLKRLIQEQLKQKLSHEILFGKLQEGGKVLVGLQEDHLSFDFTQSPSNSSSELKKESLKVES
jgi:ATP-dependent Clp protease ATP-binding subunit ClpA